ncbi:membrane-associated protein, putative [Bodo saltans]|uniref:Membrane-associated protein, putative n=1 Tax=Bodo saltans TaxID=75058 RepID=A0A0S4J3B8_BODSA|nr:membrane-associated protein, putative [Bodo saltans]|eukprot:CUG69418.1 membrane-associated protein, putative [Bodo saltans]
MMCSMRGGYFLNNIFVPIWLCVCLTAATSVAANGAARSSSTQSSSSDSDAFRSLCILPLGDSLTQGVGAHGSYRSHLFDLLQSRHANLNSHHHRNSIIGNNNNRIERSKLGVTFIGSSNRTCTPKKPLERFPHDTFDQPHEGHCSWNSRQLSEYVLSFIEHQSKGRALVDGDVSAETPAPPPSVFGVGGADEAERLFLARGKQHAAATYAKKCRFGAVDVSLLLIGHNDAFQAARKCKIKEAIPISGASDKKNAALANAAALKDTKAAACVSQFLADFETNVVNLVDGLFEAYPLMRLVVGLNPTTNFPVVDVVLHHILLSVVGEHGRGRSNVATFDDWERRHTFDSTHPNEMGSKYMALRWYEAMRQLPVPLVQLVTATGVGGGDRDDGSLLDAAIIDASRDGQVISKLQRATPQLLPLKGIEEFDDDDEHFPFRVSRLLFLMFTVTFLLAVAVRRVRMSLRGLALVVAPAALRKWL